MVIVKLAALNEGHLSSATLTAASLPCVGTAGRDPLGDPSLGRRKATDGSLTVSERDGAGPFAWRLLAGEQP